MRQLPNPGEFILKWRGDTVKVELCLDVPAKGRAVLRTNLGGAAGRRREIIAETEDGEIEGFININALASNPDAQDSFNCNFAIADEVAAYRKAAQYNRFKEAMKAYRNKLMIGIKDGAVSAIHYVEE